ncbi:unnamed protein product [Phytophthora fragariaefolia]|uniref:Unnamed protein product n=1 Tax=Phytophthora fragariaefolia TaxID=1490495 RepID=A0A9W6Y627_9STRA|nr:unnamed protein product [Phytophthora fragariaefolia]
MPSVMWGDIDYISAPPTPPSGVSTVDLEDERRLPFSRRKNPLENASLPSIVLAHWIQPMVSLGAERVLELKDMWPIGMWDSCDALEARFRQVYDPSPQFFGISPVAVAYAKTFRRELMIVLFGSILYVVALAAQSYVAQALLQFLNNRENVFGISNGYWLVAMMPISSLVTVCTVNYVFFTTSRIGANIRSLTMTLVFDKALRLSNASRQEYTTEEILTLMSADAERVFTATLQSPWHVMGPLAFVISIMMIGVLLDAYSALAGAVVLVTSEALQGIRVMKYYAWEESLAERVEKLRDEEVGLMRKFHSFQVINTVMLFLTPTFLSGVTLGLYVLIHNTIDVVEAFTLIAMVNICRPALFQLPQAISSFCKAKISLSRIDTFLASDEITTDFTHGTTCSPSLTPLIASNYIDEVGSVVGGEISIQDASFAWPMKGQNDLILVVTAKGQSNENVKSTSALNSNMDQDKACPDSLLEPVTTKAGRFQLQNVNLHIQRGSLVMIVGKVGSGKSSLINAILGEMPQMSGLLEVGGQIAYVSQDTWIRNATLRDNILFEEPYDDERYARVLDASQLAMDLRALPNGDQTEIGERGINLSGGQKARVAIARAMYRSGTDVLILDDPLSAMDPHVAHAIFEKCIVGLAGGQTRLLVLNSHYDLLAKADVVVVLENGVISIHGAYEDVRGMLPGVHRIDGGDGETTSLERTPATRAIGNSDAVPVSSDDLTNIEESKCVTEEGEPGLTGRLVEEEDRVRGPVGGHVYKTYFDESGFNGVLVTFVLSLGYCASQAVRTLVDWWPGHWARNMTRFGVGPSYSGISFGMWYLGLVVVCSALTVARALMLIASCMRTSQKLHDELFRRVLGAPVTRYFDVTPVGRILNRFSNDLDQMDAVLPEEYQLLFQNVSMAVGTLVVSAFASYWIAVLYIPLLVIFEFMGDHFKKSSCELKRLEGITRTSVYNLFSETLSGLATIRAFKMERESWSSDIGNIADILSYADFCSSMGHAIS